MCGWSATTNSLKNELLSTRLGRVRHSPSLTEKDPGNPGVTGTPPECVHRPTLHFTEAPIDAVKLHDG